MRKLCLDLDQLDVQSFATAEGTAGAGTVRGNLDVAVDGPKVALPPHGDSGCVATYDPCTCVPIETCSCGPDTTVPVTDPTGRW
jgi:hypothetical protein